MPTLQEAAVLVLELQNASNLSGVLRTFHEVVSDVLWPEANKRGLGTEWVAHHAITTIFLDKLCDLNGIVTDPNKLSLAYAEVKAIAAFKPEVQ
jgi:hypothetical protein